MIPSCSVCKDTKRISCTHCNGTGIGLVPVEGASGRNPDGSVCGVATHGVCRHCGGRLTIPCQTCQPQAALASH